MTIVLPEPPTVRHLAELRLFPVSSPERIEVGELTIDLHARRVEVLGRRVSLAPKEYELLLALAAAPTRVFRKAELLRSVWGFHSLSRTRTLDAHACRLRRKLAGDDPARFVVNEWGYGYKLID
ncbi:MAG: two-component system, OmpR family, phosphate regulon response regulator PhoB [Gaiellaceae bacterium]|jgi:DNA-binding response OmpR family regulator|nr:two-component system, OmpR family, phosphate regulon response regulator PhoB [Gaiellaceae bacterium]